MGISNKDTRQNYSAMIPFQLGCTIQNLLNTANVGYLKVLKTFIVMVSLSAIK